MSDDGPSEELEDAPALRRRDASGCYFGLRSAVRKEREARIGANKLAMGQSSSFRHKEAHNPTTCEGCLTKAADVRLTERSSPERSAKGHVPHDLLSGCLYAHKRAIVRRAIYLVNAPVCMSGVVSELAMTVIGCLIRPQALGVYEQPPVRRSAPWRLTGRIIRTMIHAHAPCSRPWAKIDIVHCPVLSPARHCPRTSTPMFGATGYRCVACVSNCSRSLALAGHTENCR
ncbi:hypothetical protein C8Q77DRAFT_271252 [Trametes polyzona]|nr:hypothetical protein C8Q77DRAFT_271252 [Trametes polyzona]